MKVFRIKRVFASTYAKIFLLTTNVLILWSCNSKEFNNEEELLRFIKDKENGYTQHKITREVDFELMYRPTDLFAKREIESLQSESGLSIDSIRNKYNSYIYFNLSISKRNKELLSVVPKNSSEFSVLSNKLSFGMGESIFLITAAKDTLEMVDYLYPKMYGVSQSTSMLFVFDRDESKLKNQKLNFIIKDLGLDTGEVNFKVENNILNKEPRLVFKQ
jgi:hypothetical protein